MKNIFIWVGYFPTEKEFNKYIDQSAFRKWWADNDEENLALSSDFCKEIGISDYDEDFLILKYNEHSSDLNDLCGLIPANGSKIEKACKEKKITKANAVICYNVDEEIDSKKAKLPKIVTFLGKFPFDTSAELGTAFSLAGLRNMLWIGKTGKTEEEFMQYFNQDDYMNSLLKFESGETTKRPSSNLCCQFCKDLNIKHYYPEYLTVFYSQKELNAKEIIEKYTKDKELFKDMISFSLHANVTMANAIFLYIPNGYRDKKKDQKITIFRKASIGKFAKPSGALDELDNYNDLKYIGTFSWD